MKNRRFALFCCVLLFLCIPLYSERGDFEPASSMAPTIPDAASATMVAVPYFNDFETDITGWTRWADNFGCFEFPPLIYCSDIVWEWVANPEAIQVAADIFPNRVDFPEEIIDGLSVAYLPSAHSGNHVWWCGSWDGGSSNGTFIGDDYSSLPPTADDGGVSLNQMEATLTSPVFNTAGLSEVLMSFWTWWEVECINICSYDIMEIEISVDGGGWVSLDILNPPFEMLPGWDEWESYSTGGYLEYGHWVLWTYDLSAYAGHDIQIRFHFDTQDALYNGFRGWFIDDFYIGGGPEYGELEWELNAPTTMGVVDCAFSPNPFTAQFTVWNSGGATVHDVTATLQLPPGMHLVSGSEIVSFGDIPSSGSENCTWEIFADDSLVGNRCFIVQLTSADSLTGYRDNFDDMPPLFTGDPTGSFDYTDYSTITRAGAPISGTGFAGIPATGGTYSEAGAWSLTSNVMNIAGFLECYIYFWHWINVRETGLELEAVDGGIMEINVNATGWQQVDEFATGMLSPRYDGFILNTVANPLALKLAYCHDNGAWAQVRSHDLISIGYCAPGDNLQVRFRFGTGSYSPDPAISNGWYIDDFVISSTGHPIGPYEVTHCMWFPVVSIPEVTTFRDTTICLGETAVLNSYIDGGTAPLDYNWFPTTGLSTPTSPSTNATPTTTTIYFLEVRDEIGCVDTDSVVVIVDEVVISVWGDTTICAGDTAIVGVVISSGFEPFVYLWTSSAEIITPAAGTTAVVATEPSWVFCFVTDSAGCTAMDSAFIDVIPLPEVPLLISPADGESLVIGTIELTWEMAAEADEYYVIVDGDTIATTSLTNATFYDAVCGGSYSWFVIAHNECGNSASDVWDFYIRPCSGPSANIIEPMPDRWSSCIDQNIVIAISDSDGIDPTTIRLTVNTTTYIVDGTTLIWDGTYLQFIPPVDWTNGQSVSVCLDSVDDIYGNPLEGSLCWDFYIDLSPPHFWGEFPTGTVPTDIDYVGFHLEDTLSGLDTGSISAVIRIGMDEYTYAVGYGIEFLGDSFWIDVSGVDFMPGDTVEVCVFATDTTDYCADNELDTCWTFLIEGCDLVAYACEDAYLCPGGMISIGAVPPYSGGTPIYSVTWKLLDGTIIATTENPIVSAESTIAYVLEIIDGEGCSSSDTIIVHNDFEPITIVELLYPPADTMLPPGIQTLCWHVLDGNPPVLYNVIIDDDTVAWGITDTCYSFSAGCDETHAWTIEAYNRCISSIPHCDSMGVTWTEAETTLYYADSVANPWGWIGDPPFHTYPCDGPVAYIERPMPDTWTSCYPESIIIRIEDEDGILDSTILLEVDSIPYTVDSSALIWSEPYLIFYPGWLDETSDLYVCLRAVEDSFGNPLTGDSLCWIFGVDLSAPVLNSISPLADTMLFTTSTDIFFVVHDWLSKPDSFSLIVAIDGDTFMVGDGCLSIIPDYCGGYCLSVQIDSSCIEFSPCDTVTVSIHVTDSTDYCDDNVLDTSWTFFTDCEGPHAEAVHIPVDWWSSCPEDSIIIYLWDSLPGVDETTISLDITGIGTISFPSPGLSYDAVSGMLVYYPALLPGEGAITVTLLSADDLLGNPLEEALTWSFYRDTIAPIAFDWLPICDDSVASTHPDISIEPYDSGCGIVLDSTVLIIYWLWTFYEGHYIDGDFIFDGTRFIFDPATAGISFPGGTDVEVCWHLVDCAGDICEPNVIDTCCHFYISTGGPFSNIFAPGDSEWVACVPETIPIVFEDEDGILDSTIQFEVCFGGDCSDCSTYDLSSSEVHGVELFDDSVHFWFVPSPSFADGDTVCIHIIYAEDSLGNSIFDGGYGDSAYFYIDYSAPVIWNMFPTGDLSEIPTEIVFHLADSLSGLDLGTGAEFAIRVFVMGDACTTDIMSIGEGLDFDGDSFWITDDWCECSPGETIYVSVMAYDTPDTCEPNVLMTEWWYVCPGCDLVADACDDSWLCPGHSMQLGALPPATGGTPPLSYLWSTADIDTVSVLTNPLVSPDSTTTYYLFVSDDYGCESSDSVTVHVDFEPVSTCELTYPPSDTVFPPGTATLYWHALDGTPTIFYDVIIDGDTVQCGTTDTSYTFDIDCGETHEWTIVAYNCCLSQISHCDTSGIWIEDDSICYFADSVYMMDGNPIFYTIPCDGPEAFIERPAENKWSSCEPESIIIRIEDDDGIDSETLLLVVNGIEYTFDSTQIIWNEPYLIFYPLEELANAETVHVCLEHIEDIYGNPIASALCWNFMMDFAAPSFVIVEPDSAAMIHDYEQDIVLFVNDGESGVDSASIGIAVDGIERTDAASLIWNGESWIVRFVPENSGIKFAPGETVWVEISACDSPDYCAPHCRDISWFFWTAPQIGCLVHPNPFTPNGDGTNDFIVFDYPEMFGTSATLAIYNLRGIEVFRGEIGPVSRHDNHIPRRWNGSDNNNIPLPEGLYMYVIFVDGETVCNGTVIIAR